MPQFRLRPLDQTPEVVGPKTRQNDHLRTGKKRGVQFKGRVLGRRADQQQGSVLHMRQKPVLLRFVEPVDLVDKKQRALPVGPSVSCRFEHLAQVGDASKIALICTK